MALFRNNLLVVASVALFGGCAGPGAVDQAESAAYEESVVVDVAKNTDVECRYEKQTGSHMVERVCISAERRREMEEASQQWLRTRGRSGGVERVRDSADPRGRDDP